MMMKGRATVQKEIGPLSDPAEKNYLELLCELEISLYFIWAIYIGLVSFLWPQFSTVFQSSYIIWECYLFREKHNLNKFFVKCSLKKKKNM